MTRATGTTSSTEATARARECWGEEEVCDPSRSPYGVHLFLAFWPGHKTVGASRAWKMAKQIIDALGIDPAGYTIRDYSRGNMSWTLAPADFVLVWPTQDEEQCTALMLKLAALTEATWPRRNTHCVSGGATSATTDVPFHFQPMPICPCCGDGWRHVELVEQA